MGNNTLQASAPGLTLHFNSKAEKAVVPIQTPSQMMNSHIGTPATRENANKIGLK